MMDELVYVSREDYERLNREVALLRRQLEEVQEKHENARDRGDRMVSHINDLRGQLDEVRLALEAIQACAKSDEDVESDWYVIASRALAGAPEGEPR